MVLAAICQESKDGISIPLRLEAGGSVFVVFHSKQKSFDPIVGFTRNGESVLPLTQPSVIKIQKAIYGVPGDAARTRDVRVKMQAMSDRGEINFRVAKLAEGDDPAYGTVKTLELKYTVNDREFAVSGRDPETINLVTTRPAASRAAEVRYDSAGRLQVIASQPGHYELKTATGKTRLVEVAVVLAPQEITGAWEVSFPSKWGAPEKITLDHLISLSESSNSGVKYFSGTATYLKTFEWGLASEKRKGKSEVWLDLGEVQVMARVKLNGHDLGILWKSPFQINITGALKPGQNNLELSVANLWPNRMIGDAALPESQRFTWSSYEPFTKDTPLPKSGLLGPVIIQTKEIMTVP
jgi:hypothetical protein